MAYPLISTDHLCELFEAGYPAAQIARMYDVSDIFVRKRLKSRGYTLHPGRPRIYDDPKSRPSYTRKLAKAKEQRRTEAKHRKELERKRQVARDAYEATHGEVDRRRRMPSLCRKGDCRWLTHTCTRPPHLEESQPRWCPYDHTPGPHCAGDSSSSNFKDWSSCRYYRAPCSRYIRDCPFRFRTQWECENCMDIVPIGDIHFATWSGGRALMERKFRFDKFNPTVPAMALCTSCLEEFRAGANPDPMLDW